MLRLGPPWGGFRAWDMAVTRALPSSVALPPPAYLAGSAREVMVRSPSLTEVQAPARSSVELAMLATQNAGDYVALKKRIQDAGLLRKQPLYYVLCIATNLALLALAAWILFSTRDWRWLALDAIFLGVVSGQLGFQLHDSGHRQMFDHGWMNTVVGFLTGDVLLGMSYGWWVSKHNAHHANPNDIDDDPDVNSPAIAYTREQAMSRRGWVRKITAYQAYWFFPMITLMGFSMHVSGTSYLIRKPSRLRSFELVTLAFHAILYLAFFIILLGPALGLMVVLIHKVTGGVYMALVFAPNHKGMPQTNRAERPGFLERQVLTARNVKASRVKDLIYGSLNYQIEHHLFPSMPRRNLRKASKIIREYCAEIDLPYYETTMLQSYRELLGFLDEVGRSVRAPA